MKAGVEKDMLKNNYINSLTFYFSLYFAKFVYLFIRLLNLGNGYVLPGYLILKVFPDILRNPKITYSKGIVLVTGTNGKTTTASLLTHILRGGGMHVTHNKSGANLKSGILTSILLGFDWFGRNSSDIGIFEVDEFAFPAVLRELSPRIVVLLNLSRDQLDRYGEVDIVMAKWKEALLPLTPPPTLLVNTDQKEFEELEDKFKGKLLKFDAAPVFSRKTKLRGEFNAKNVNTAVLAAVESGLSPDIIEQGLKSFEAAYGRGETIKYKGKSFQLFLAKNPASFNHNLALAADGGLEFDTLLFILNDNIPDGRDVSWIYDIDAEKLAGVCKEKLLFVSGTRCLDMGVRLNYSGVPLLAEDVGERLTHILEKIAGEPRCLNILVLPNYSAMLEVRKFLSGRNIL